jgi:iron(III) transport system ATP-binding protein
MAYLALTAIEKTYGQFRALDRVSLDIEEGEFVCFLGPSGCGKTSLLRIIAGLDRQSAGRVEIAGKDCSNAPPEQRDYGIVFQSYALFPNLTVARNVAYGLPTRDKAAAERRVAEMLDLVGLPDVGGRYPGQLSGGQQQRIALARALAPSPRLLLLDEPLSALDARVRISLRRQIRALHDRLGLTTIMVTHDQEEALTLADRIVVMNHGCIEQVATPAEIYARPASLFVAGFVGAMNILPATATGRGSVRLGGIELAGGQGFAEGEAVSLCWRPEDLLIDAAGEVEALVESVEFLGPYHRATLRAGDLGAFAVDVAAERMRDLGLSDGSAVRIGLPADRLRIFGGHPS